MLACTASGDRLWDYLPQSLTTSNLDEEMAIHIITAKYSGVLLAKVNPTYYGWLLKARYVVRDSGQFGPVGAVTNV